ncbi:VOC family protein [Svornostia abyssi]|uniref:Bleomycin resistance protein n=1 Tax=Svornostia abyssi TaxID=2898438 RepID=A0ABY5PLW0_9ACTN|nr:VOC family protein [Parviterribacteraceae bacterium J379]
MRPRLVPELICTDLKRSCAFYCDVAGFAVRYAREEERFVLLEREGAQLMLEEPASASRLLPAGATLEPPYGRGMHLEIDVDDVGALHDATVRAGLEPLLPLEDRWYERADDAVLVRQFAVQDPDGYVLRFTEELEARRG